MSQKMDLDLFEIFHLEYIITSWGSFLCVFIGFVCLSVCVFQTCSPWIFPVLEFCNVLRSTHLHEPYGAIMVSDTLEKALYAASFKQIAFKKKSH